MRKKGNKNTRLELTKTKTSFFRGKLVIKKGRRLDAKLDRRNTG
jgi:hypothetical protein